MRVSILLRNIFNKKVVGLYKKNCLSPYREEFSYTMKRVSGVPKGKNYRTL